MATFDSDNDFTELLGSILIETAEGFLRAMGSTAGFNAEPGAEFEIQLSVRRRDMSSGYAN